jgi:hypothetical protein
MAQSMGYTMCNQILLVNLVDFVSNVKLRLNKSHTFTNLTIISNISICEIWEMTFFTNVLKASYTNWDYQCPCATYNHNIKIHGINIRNSFHYFYFQIKSFQYTRYSHFNILQSWLWNFDLLSSCCGLQSTFQQL